MKGQLTVLVPQPEIDYATLGGVPGTAREEGGFGIHMLPRSDGIILGGTSERGEWSLEPNEEARRRVVEDHIELFEANALLGSGPMVGTDSIFLHTGRSATRPRASSGWNPRVPSP